MAGIGFELRKIYGKKTLASKVYGSLYATMATIGPTILFMLLLLLINLAMGWYQVPELDRLTFTSSFTYLFLGAILISSLHNAVLSRYISDKVFENREQEIADALAGCLITGTTCSAVVMLVLCVTLYGNGLKDLLLLSVYYLLGIFVTNAYNLLIFVSALKEYRKITASYLVGLAVSAPVFLVLLRFTRMPFIQAAYAAVAISFLLINVFLVLCCMRAFGQPQGKYFGFLRYYKKYPALLVSGGLYMLGFYLSNMIYWAFSDYVAVVCGLKTIPAYDLATFMAIVVNLPSMVIFVVSAETAFYEKYVAYLSALGKGSYARIEKARLSLQKTTQSQLFFVYEAQLIITIIAICVAVVAAPYLMLSDTVVTLFSVLAIGFFCLFSMYYTVIMLYYFQAYKASAIAVAAFVAVEILGCVICLPMNIFFYSVPMVAGPVIGWVIAFVYLRKLIRDLNSAMLCR